jgi:hypothetical protein
MKTSVEALVEVSSEASGETSKRISLPSEGVCITAEGDIGRDISYIPLYRIDVFFRPLQRPLSCPARKTHVALTAFALSHHRRVIAKERF